MSSFLSGFKAFTIALAAIIVIEAAVFAVHPSSFVERSNYLDWNYGAPEIFHKALIYQKLDDFAYSVPDIVQVGDSSGFHGVRPDIVMRYLGGMKYLNLSCCANTGYDGYYAIADFMLRRNPGIKALVLYISLNAMPHARLVGGDRATGGAERIRGSFTDLWAYLSPPSMALRRQVTDAVYSRWGTLRPREARFFEAGEVFSDMLESIRVRRGWWSEHDARLAGSRLRAYWNEFCGADGTKVMSDEDGYSIYDPLLGRRSYTRAYFRHFADLAAHYGARLVVVFQPYPCLKVTGEFMSARRADLQFVRKTNKNFDFEPESIFEPWPMEAFASWYHLRVGYDEKNSERVGRLLARALHISADRQDDEGSLEKVRPAAEASVPQSIWTAGSAEPSRQADGVLTGPSDNSDGLSSPPIRMIEGGEFGHHLVRMEIDGAAASRYVVSAIVKPIQARGLRLEILDVGSSANRGNVDCNLKRLEAQRGAGGSDAGLEVLPDGWMRCWLVPTFAASAAILNLVVLNESGQRVYAGDGSSGLLFKDVTLQPWQQP
jgi:hypothetical protein